MGCLVFVGRPLGREDGVCLLYMLLKLASAVFLGSESLATRDHILLPQIWDFPFPRLLRLAGSRWRYSTPPPHELLSVVPSNCTPYIVAARTTSHRNTASALTYRKHLPASLLLLLWDVTARALHNNGPCADYRKYRSCIVGRVCVVGVT
jgi:hypothetical protein